MSIGAKYTETLKSIDMLTYRVSIIPSKNNYGGILILRNSVFKGIP